MYIAGLEEPFESLFSLSLLAGELDYESQMPWSPLEIPLILSRSPSPLPMIVAFDKCDWKLEDIVYSV